MQPLELPDEPRWVEAHGIAADPEGWRVALGRGGFAVGHDRMRLIVIAGAADAAAVVALARERPQHTLLIASDELVAALRRGAGRGAERALLHTLPDPDALPDLDGAVPFTGDPPGELADEITLARSRGATVWAVHVDDAPVSFAYAPWRSARWFDISVDTLPRARQLGLATIVATAMIRDERARGREPVWGADEHNHASLALARRLGFQSVDEIWVASPSTSP